VASSTLPFGEVTAGVTDATPGVCAAAARSWPKAVTSRGEPAWTASSVDTLEMLIAWLSRPMSEFPRMSAKPAPARGSSEASTAPPKMTSRMTSAASTPTATVKPGLGRSELVMDWPLREICTVVLSADSAALIRLLASAVVTWLACLSQMTTAKATVPSRLISPPPA
jgi:hypothetical protein